MDPSRQLTSKYRALSLSPYGCESKEPPRPDNLCSASSFMIHVSLQTTLHATAIYFLIASFIKLVPDSESLPVWCIVQAHMNDDGLEVLGVYITGRTEDFNVSDFAAKTIIGTNPNKHYHHHHQKKFHEINHTHTCCRHASHAEALTRFQPNHKTQVARATPTCLQNNRSFNLPPPLGVCHRDWVF
ncbi:unnamed protein product, partial [Ectocarpus sp. 12 AP-2014]